MLSRQVQELHPDAVLREVIINQQVNIDPTTVATVWHSMQTICKEMRHLVKRTAQNYLIGQLQDLSVGIWGADGSTIAVPVGLPNQHLGTTFAVKALVKMFEGNIYPGDVFLTNDPYHGGHNTHLPDWGYIRPIFYKDELLFFTLCRGHQTDTGGSFPGGYFPNGYDIHAEGLIIPPIKVIERGKERKDLVNLILSNVRFSDGVRVDLHAMIGSTTMCEKRILALIEMYGRDTVMASIEEMIRRTELAVREEIRKIPDGVYYGEAATDDDGTTLDEPVWVRARITVKDDRDDDRPFGKRRAAQGLRQLRLRRNLRHFGGGGDSLLRSRTRRLSQSGHHGADQGDRAAGIGGELPIPGDRRRLPGQCRRPDHGSGGRGAVEGAAQPGHRRLGQASRRLPVCHGSAYRRALRPHLLRL